MANRSPMARPRKEIDARKVEQLATVGCPPDWIAAELDCSENTIKRRFGPLVKKGEMKGKTRIRSKLYQMSMQGNLGAAIFLAKAWCGMREPREDAVTVNVSQTAITLTPQQLKANLTELRQAVREEAKRFVLN